MFVLVQQKLFTKDHRYRLPIVEHRKRHLQWIMRSGLKLRHWKLFKGVLLTIGAFPWFPGFYLLLRRFCDVTEIWPLFNIPSYLFYIFVVFYSYYTKPVPPNCSTTYLIHMFTYENITIIISHEQIHLLKSVCHPLYLLLLLFFYYLCVW